jgi:hypothetical protein
MVLHRKARIILTVYEASKSRDSLPGDNFGNEHNAPAFFSALLSANVEAQVYFVKIRMKRDGNSPEELGVAKAKAH